MSALSLLLLYFLLSSISLSVLSDITPPFPCSSCTLVSSQTHLGICLLPCSTLLQFPLPSPSAIHCNSHLCSILAWHVLFITSFFNASTLIFLVLIVPFFAFSFNRTFIVISWSDPASALGNALLGNVLQCSSLLTSSHVDIITRIIIIT